MVLIFKYLNCRVRTQIKTIIKPTVINKNKIKKQEELKC